MIKIIFLNSIALLQRVRSAWAQFGAAIICATCPDHPTDDGWSRNCRQYNHHWDIWKWDISVTNTWMKDQAREGDQGGGWWMVRDRCKTRPRVTWGMATRSWYNPRNNATHWNRAINRNSSSHLKVFTRWFVLFVKSCLYAFSFLINKKSWNDFVMCTLSLCPISFEWKIILKKYSTFLAYFTWGEVWQFCPSQVYDTRSIPTSQKFFLGTASAVKAKIGSNSELGWFNLLKTDTAPVEIRIQLFRHESGG